MNVPSKLMMLDNVPAMIFCVRTMHVGLSVHMYNINSTIAFHSEPCPVVPPVITLSPSSTRDVVSGEVLSVTCAAVGEPAPRVLWYHIGLALNTSVSNGVTTVDLTTVTIGKTTTSSLRVLNVTDEDAGLYTCVAVNFLGNDSSDFVVSLVGGSQ